MRYAPASPEMHVALAATLSSTGRLSDAESKLAKRSRTGCSGGEERSRKRAAVEEAERALERDAVARGSQFS